MAQVVTVTKHDQSQNNKDRVYFDNRHSYADAYYVKQGLYRPDVGATVEVETHQWQNKWFLDSWRASSQAAPVAPQRPQAPPPSRNSGNGRSRPTEDPMELARGWDIQSGDLSRYVSNVVASAISAGLIKEPSQVHDWARSAYMSGNALVRGEYPNWHRDPDPNENQDRDPDEGRFTDDGIPF